MRQIILDTETTGLGVECGHRIIEIGCIEMVSRKLTGNNFHTFLNPERDVDEGAFRVHGISSSFLADKPLFKNIMGDFLSFIAGAEIIIHNATFDTKFLNAELQRVAHPKCIEDYSTILDTLVLARKKHPGQRNTLDALCKRYNVNNSHRELHGALLDAKLLALVYLAMTGGQADFFANDTETLTATAAVISANIPTLTSTSPVYFADENELKRHNDFVEHA